MNDQLRFFTKLEMGKPLADQTLIFSLSFPTLIWTCASPTASNLRARVPATIIQNSLATYPRHPFTLISSTDAYSLKPLKLKMVLATRFPGTVRHRNDPDSTEQSSPLPIDVPHSNHISHYTPERFLGLILSTANLRVISSLTHSCGAGTRYSRPSSYGYVRLRLVLKRPPLGMAYSWMWLRGSTYPLSCGDTSIMLICGITSGTGALAKCPPDD